MGRNKILQEDIDSFLIPADLREQLRDSVIIVTGATGLIGSTLIRCLHSLQLGIRFILPVRNIEKGQRMFQAEKNSVLIIEDDLIGFFNTTDLECDYIIHCASPTDGKYMCAHPSETFLLPIESAHAILDYSVRSKVRGVVYLSSIEYYGQIFTGEEITEDKEGYVDRESPRSSYALGKQATEYLACCYAQEYGVPVKNARLTQTFGAGISKEDNRVFAQFARSVIEGRDIVLHTEGRSAKPYCYTTDCVAAIIYILLKGKPGESYNVAAPGTYVTIREFAELCRDSFNPDIEVRVEERQNTGYAPETTVNLNSDKLRALGWQPRYGLKEMMERLIEYLKS